MCKGILTFFHIWDDQQPSHLREQSSKSFSGLLQNEMNRHSLAGRWSQLMRLRLFNWLDNAKGREIKDDRVGNLEIDTIKVHQVSWWGAGVWENVWAGETHMSQT